MCVCVIVFKHRTLYRGPFGTSNFGTFVRPMGSFPHPSCAYGKR